MYLSTLCLVNGKMYGVLVVLVIVWQILAGSRKWWNSDQKSKKLDSRICNWPKLQIIKVTNECFNAFFYWYKNTAVDHKQTNNPFLKHALYLYAHLCQLSKWEHCHGPASYFSSLNILYLSINLKDIKRCKVSNTNIILL